MKESTKELKFCAAGVLIIFYGFLYFIVILGDFSLNTISSLISPIFFIIMGIALLYKNKSVNAIFWALSILTPIFNIFAIIKWMNYEANAIDYRFIYANLINDIISIIVFLMLIICSINMGKLYFSWTIVKLFVFIYGASIVFNKFVTFSHTYFINFSTIDIIYFIMDVIWFVAILLYVMWTEKPYIDGYTISKAKNNTNCLPDSAYIELTSHVLLLLFTFGIYWLHWIYKTTQYTNSIKSMKQRTASAQVLLCLFIPFYVIYWVYKTAQIIDKTAQMSDIFSDITSICTILAVFVGIVPPILIQDKINMIESANNKIKPNFPL